MPGHVYTSSSHSILRIKLFLRQSVGQYGSLADFFNMTIVCYGTLQLQSAYICYFKWQHTGWR